MADAPKTYSHLCTLAFTVVTGNDAENITPDELRTAIRLRLEDLERSADRGHEEILEACLPPTRH